MNFEQAEKSENFKEVKAIEEKLHPLFKQLQDMKGASMMVAIDIPITEDDEAKAVRGMRITSCDPSELAHLIGSTVLGSFGDAEEAMAFLMKVATHLPTMQKYL